MKLIFVCSPLRGDYEKNLQLARDYCHYVVDQGGMPYAPHVFFTQFLDDKLVHERKQGMDMGLEMLKRCDELWVFGDDITQGMAVEIEFANELNLPIRHI